MPTCPCMAWEKHSRKLRLVRRWDTTGKLVVGGERVVVTVTVVHVPARVMVGGEECGRGGSEMAAVKVR